MKKILITLFLVISSMTIQAQEALTWHTDLDDAILISKTEQKPIFFFFTGSDWCGWCIRLQNEVFKTPEFIAWAKEKVVLVELDFPRGKAQSEALKLQNSQLQQFFQVRGYPTVWFAKSGAPVEGKTSFEKLGSSGYLAGGPSVWLASANKIISNFVPYSDEEQKAAEKLLNKKKADAKKAAKKKETKKKA
jgi:protein disulfide-isomerase